MDNPKIVSVQWTDANFMKGWANTEEVIDQPMPTCITIGYLVHEDSATIKLAQTYSRTGKWCDVMYIPHDMIESYVIIRESGDE